MLHVHVYKLHVHGSCVQVISSHNEYHNNININVSYAFSLICEFTIWAVDYYHKFVKHACSQCLLFVVAFFWSKTSILW